MDQTYDFNTSDVDVDRLSTVDNHPDNDAIQSSTFLCLPRELRDIIYTCLLQEHKPPPRSPDYAGPRTPNPSAPATPCTIYFEAQSPKPAFLQLKLVSHQINAEVQDLLRKHIKNSSPASNLDIMIKGSCIWPTWTHLPITPHLDPTITISLRIFETGEFSTGAYRALWSLFNRLVFQGPCFSTRGLKKPLEIKTLKFEISLCFPTTVDDLFGTYRDVFERLERLAYDNAGLRNVGTIEGCLGADRRIWRLKQLPTGLTMASRE